MAVINCALLLRRAESSILMLLPMCHMKLKEVYPALFVTTVIATTVGTAAVTLMCVLFPGLA